MNSACRFVSTRTSLFAAALLQLLLKLTLGLEHRIADYFKKQVGKSAKYKRLVATWLVLFGSKFVILGAINVVFGSKVIFGGVIPFIIIVIAVMRSAPCRAITGLTRTA